MTSRCEAVFVLSTLSVLTPQLLGDDHGDNIDIDVAFDHSLIQN